MDDKQQAYIMPENVSRTIGKDAQRNNILAAKIVADIVKTTLGPKGMDKMLVDSTGEIIITNDGVTILEEMEIEHPAAKMLVEIAKTQEEEVGDGTTTAALLAGKLLEYGEILLDRKIHPTTIIKGYNMAAEKSIKILDELAISANTEEFLTNIAITAMTGKGAEGNKERLAKLIIEAVKCVAEGREISLDHIKIQKFKGSGVQDSELLEGIVLDKERANSAMPLCVKEAKILLVDLPLELRSPENEAKIEVSTPEQLESFFSSDEKYLRSLTDKIITSGANVVFCQKGIDDIVQYYLAQAGILACRRVSKSDMEILSKATGGKILSNLNDIHASAFGEAKIVEEKKKAGEGYIYIQGYANPKVVTLIVRGATEHIVDEIERAVKDGLGDVVAVVKSGKIVAGGGAVEMELSRRLKIFARTLGGREQLAVEEFAHALESIPEALSENAGLDSLDILAELRKGHESGNCNLGLNLIKDCVEDVLKTGIIEPLKVKVQAISSATEVATMILRIDDVLVSREKSRPNDADSYSGMD